MTLTFAALARLVERGDPSLHLLGFEVLAGGASAQTVVARVGNEKGDQQKWVVRLHGERDRARNPAIAHDEFQLLKVLSGTNVPAPKPILVDEATFPDPAIVLSYIEGEVITGELPANDLTVALHAMAKALLQIHGTSVDNLNFLPAVAGRVEWLLQAELPAINDGFIGRELQLALARLWPLPASPPKLLHGDFWPGNILWRGSELAGVIDWEDAALGDLVSDISVARLDALWAFGDGADSEFLRHYEAVGGEVDRHHLAAWDLFAALRPVPNIQYWGIDAARLPGMIAQQRRFAAAALAVLG